MELKYSINDIVIVSGIISETEHVIIHSVDPSDPHPAGFKNWDYRVQSYNLEYNEAFGEKYMIKETEVIGKSLISP